MTLTAEETYGKRNKKAAFSFPEYMGKVEKVDI